MTRFWLLAVAKRARGRFAGAVKLVFGHPKGYHSVKPPRHPVISVAFNPKTKILGRADGKNITLWNIAKGKATGFFKVHTASFNSLAFSPDGKMLASASWQPSAGN